MSGQIKAPGAGAEGPAWGEEKGTGKVRATAILLAGGSGTRFGAAGNKVYVEAKGKPLLQYSVDALEQAEGLSEWILVVKDGQIVERGQHRDLVHGGGVYQELYETQFSRALETAESLAQEENGEQNTQHKE